VYRCTHHLGRRGYAIKSSPEAKGFAKVTVIPHVKSQPRENAWTDGGCDSLHSCALDGQPNTWESMWWSVLPVESLTSVQGDSQFPVLHPTVRSILHLIIDAAYFEN
jgi:hypothetical protein